MVINIYSNFFCIRKNRLLSDSNTLFFFISIFYNSNFAAHNFTAQKFFFFFQFSYLRCSQKFWALLREEWNYKCNFFNAGMYKYTIIFESCKNCNVVDSWWHHKLLPLCHAITIAWLFYFFFFLLRGISSAGIAATKSYSEKSFLRSLPRKLFFTLEHYKMTKWVFCFLSFKLFITKDSKNQH